MPSHQDPLTGRWTTLKRRQQVLAKIEKQRRAKLAQAEARGDALSVENPKVRKLMQRQKLIAKTIQKNQRKRYRPSEAGEEKELLAAWDLELGIAPDAEGRPYEYTHQGILYAVSTYKFRGLQEGEKLAKALLRVLRETEPESTRAWGAIGASEYDSGDSESWLTLEFNTLNGLLAELETWRTKASAGRILDAARNGAEIWYLIYVARVKKPRKPRKKKNGSVEIRSKPAPAKGGSKKRRAARKPGGAGKASAKRTQHGGIRPHSRQSQKSKQRLGKTAAPPRRRHPK